jgi:2'-5' RNA ligase
MTRHGLTPEFSICLLPDQATQDDVEAIRQTLPPSPYRDDTPHLTLLRTIKCPSLVEDDALLQQVDSLLELSNSLPLEATTVGALNAFSPIYKMSSGILLETSDKMTAYRASCIARFKANGFTLSPTQSLQFRPHITIRLGAPMPQQVQTRASESFPVGRTIAFGAWVVFRVVYQDGKRMMKELYPTS